MVNEPTNGDRGVVGSAMGRIDFPSAATSEALADIAQRLEGEYPHHKTSPLAVVGEGLAGHLLASADSFWKISLTPTSIALGTTTAQSAEGFITRLQRLAAPLEAVLLPQTYNRVELRYFQAGPTSGSPHGEFLASMGIPWERTEELTQTLKGSLPKGHFILRFGIHPADEESVYVADASVFIDFVPQPDLITVLYELEHEGLHLLDGAAKWEGSSLSRGKVLTLNYDSWLERALGPGYDLFAIEPPACDLFEPINEERLRLLNRKYSGLPFSLEDEIRLQDLGERVRRLLPRVTDRDFAELEAMSSRTDDLAETVRKIRERYHLGDPQ
ncbi:MAG TPA: hypothetical protein VGS07_19700 [Thermoanaerobaculia bacterium]|jgi:hypothetical protein|nr:hypothetical protein [Thermoanaerobaculia bacterium]